MADGTQHQIFGFERKSLRSHVFVQGQDARGFAFEAGDDDSTHVDDAVGVLHLQLERRVRLVVVPPYSARGGVDVGGLLAGHVGGLEAVDRLDLGVGVDDAPGRVLEHDAHRRVPQDGVHHLPLALEGIHQLQLADEHGRLTGQDAGEPSGLRRSGGHPGDQQSRQPPFDLDRDGKCIRRRTEKI